MVVNAGVTEQLLYFPQVRISLQGASLLRRVPRINASKGRACLYKVVANYQPMGGSLAISPLDPLEHLYFLQQTENLSRIGAHLPIGLGSIGFAIEIVGIGLEALHFRRGVCLERKPRRASLRAVGATAS